MCYTVEINLTREQLEKSFEAKFKYKDDFNPKRRLSAFTIPKVPVISSESPNDIQLYFWGLIPFWIKTEKDAQSIRTKTANAVSETLSQKPSFRSLFKKKHCLVLVNGFYEWQHRENIKQPYFIRMKNKHPFALAGLYDNWTSKETGEVLNTFTIITTKANEMMEKIHNTKKRMPVILDENNERKWLEMEQNDDGYRNIFTPFNQELMVAEEVDRNLFKTKSA